MNCPVLVHRVTRSPVTHWCISAAVTALGSLVSPSRLVKDCEYTADRALSRGSSEGVMPAGKHQRIEVDVAAVSRRLGLNFVDGQRPSIDVLASVGPRDCRVVGGVARLPDREDQMPLHGPAMNPRDEMRRRDSSCPGIGGLSRVFRLKRIHRHHRPSHGRRGAVRVDEAECVEAAVGGVGESG